MMTERVVIRCLSENGSQQAESFLKQKNNEVHSRVVLPKIIIFVSKNVKSALKARK
jgi:hypothetical protein